MPQIDPFLKAIFQAGAELLIFASGKKAALVTGGQMRPASGKPVSSEQIVALVREIAPDDRKQAIGQPGRHEFSYRSPGGDVQVTCVGQNGSLQVEFRPADGNGSAAEPAAESSVTAGDPQTVPIDALFRKMIAENCSDLHMSSGHPPLYRKDGLMTQMGNESTLTTDRVEALLRPITPDRNWKEFHQDNDTDFAYDLPGVARFRCNLFRDRLGIAGVFRQIPSKIPSVKDLGLSKHILGLCQLTKGLVLVTGPTGSGKSTTLAGMIQYINQMRDEHVITIEDPIEFVYPSGRCLINQREVGVHTNGFKQALRAALREDPDIVLVGEMRDLETVKIALETAETGHLVFGTLHTNTAPSTIDRVIDQFPADEQSQVRTMLSESLKGVIAQTLCRRAAGGRVAAHEVLIVNSAVANLIREAKTFQIPSIMQTGRAIGMKTMNDSLIELVKGKIVTAEEAMVKSYNRTEFTMALERHGLPLNKKLLEDPTAEPMQKKPGATAAVS